MSKSISLSFLCHNCLKKLKNEWMNDAILWEIVAPTSHHGAHYSIQPHIVYHLLNVITVYTCRVNQVHIFQIQMQISFDIFQMPIWGFLFTISNCIHHLEFTLFLLCWSLLGAASGGQQVINEARNMWQEPGLLSLGLTKQEDICHNIKDRSVPLLLNTSQFMDVYVFICL